MSAPPVTDPPGRWNHNIHHHPVILDALPDPCRRVLDVGCGEGVLARQLAARADHVTGLDRHAPTVALAAAHPGGPTNVDFVVGDVMAHPFAPGTFDAVVSVAALHHLDTATALTRLRDLVRPGGVLAVVGLARSRSPVDLAHDAAGAVATRVHRFRRGWWETSAPKVWPPPDTYGRTRRTAARELPGVRYRRHVLWRYSLIWTKPVSPSQRTMTTEPPSTPTGSNPSRS